MAEELPEEEVPEVDLVDEAAEHAAAYALTRAAILRERYIKGTYTRILNQLIEAESHILQQLERRLDGLTGLDRSRFMQDDWTTQRLIRVRESIQDLGIKYRQIINAEIRLSARELIKAELDLALAVTQSAQEAAGFAISADLSGSVSPYQVYASATSQPFNGRHLKDYMSGFETGVKQRVLQSLRTSFATGETVQEAVKNIRGTKAKGYSDGLLNVSKRGAETIVRTTMTHMAARSHLAVYDDLGVEKLLYVAVLDSRTTKGCAALDLTEWPVHGKRPEIPRHLGCRAAWAPVIDGYPLDGQRSARPKKKSILVDAKTDFDEFLKDQPEGFQREWLGPTRYKMWKNGLALEKFIDPQFKEYSIADLMDKYKKYA